MTDEEYRKFARDAINEHVKASEIDAKEVEAFIARLTYVAVDAKSEDGWAALKEAIGKKPEKIRAFYLAVSPTLFGDIASRLKTHGLITRDTRIIVEKPIGRDLESANALNDTIGSVFREDQIFRIDHYLGKETVQNLSTMCRSQLLKLSALKVVPVITIPLARCAIWCRTIFSSCFASSLWNRLRHSKPMQCMTKRSRCFAR